MALFFAGAALLTAIAMADGLPPGGTFNDDNGNVHEGFIEAIAAENVTRGCNPPANDRYCPSSQVTRGQMAAFLVRALGLEAIGADRFTDDDTSIFEHDINRLAEAGITKGCNPPANDRFCPDHPVTRGQMAAFLVRAFGYNDDGGGDRFNDDDGSIFESDIDKLGTAGVTKGCNPPQNDRFCPDDHVKRDQMASFLGRALKLDPIVPPPSNLPQLAIHRPDDGSIAFHTVDVEVVVTPAAGATTIDLFVDGALTDSEPIAAGTAVVVWDSTAVSDGEYTLRLVGRNAAGAEVAAEEITVEVANSLESLQRTEVALSQGDISVDEYAILTTEAIVVADRLPAKFAGPPVEDGGATAEVLNLLYGMETLDADTQAIVDAYWAVAEAFELDQLRADPDLDPREVLSGEADLITRASHPYWGCDKCSADSVFFTIRYAVTGTDRVPANPASDDVSSYDTASRSLVGSAANPMPNRVPDRIDHIASIADQAVDYYVDDLGYNPPPGAQPRLEMHVQERSGQSNARRGDVRPIVGWDIFLHRTASDHTIRHEVFHHIQFGYFLAQYCRPGTSWFLEGSAQWAAHLAGGSDGYQQAGSYARQLDVFLDTPNDALIEGDMRHCLRQIVFETDRAVPARAYGSFIFSEYLSGRFGPNVIRQIWERIQIRNEGGEHAIWRLGYGVAFPEVIADFWVAAYTLTDAAAVPPQWRFRNPEPHLVDWRNELANGRTSGNARGDPRPRRNHRNLDISGGTTGSTRINPGGGSFLDLSGAVITGSRLDIAIRDKAGNPGLEARLVAYDQYPELCMAPVAIPTAVGSNRVVQLAADCTFATVVMVNHGDFSSREAVWDIRVLPTDSTLVVMEGATILEFDGADWDTIGTRPGSGEYLDMVALGDELYTLRRDLGDTRYVDRYDGTSWTTVGTFAHPRAFHLATSAGNLYLLTQDGASIQTMLILQYDRAVNQWTQAASIPDFIVAGVVPTTVGGVDRLVFGGNRAHNPVAQISVYTPATGVVSSGTLNGTTNWVNWGPSVEIKNIGTDSDVVYAGHMTSRRMYESTDGVTWTEFAAPRDVKAMTVGDDGYVYIGSWFELDAPPEGHSFYRFNGSTFELVDNQTEVEWLALATFNGEILGGGGSSEGVLRLTGTGPADWSFERIYTSTTGSPIDMIVWTR